MSEDLASYLDSWADLLAANVERRASQAAEEARQDTARLQQTVDDLRATLGAELAALRERVIASESGTRSALDTLASDAATLRRDVAGLAETLAGIRDRVTQDLTELRSGLSTSGDGLKALGRDVGSLGESLATLRQDLEYAGSEAARANAGLESLQQSVSAIQDTLDQLPETINTALNRDLADDLAAARQELEASEFAALDDMLALLDSIEGELDAGRQVLLTLSAIPRDAPQEAGGLSGMLRAMGRSSDARSGPPPLPIEGIERLVEGVQTTHRRLLDALARRGVTAIEAVGARFDPTFHEAVAFEPCPPNQDGLVLREQRRGYRTADAVVRMAHVVVGRAES